jgi:hypothetical protein
MRRKTFLTPEQQWCQSVDFLKETRLLGDRLYFSDFDVFGEDEKLDWRRVPPERLGPKHHLYLGRIRHPHRWFLKHDYVFIRITNGWNERQPVWSVSSKGYAIRGLYLKYQSFWFEDEASEAEDHARWAGPLEFVELPDDVVGKTPDDPAVRQFAATLRAGDAAPR